MFLKLMFLKIIVQFLKEHYCIEILKKVFKNYMLERVVSTNILKYGYVYYVFFIKFSEEI